MRVKKASIPPRTVSGASSTGSRASFIGADWILPSFQQRDMKDPGFANPAIPLEVAKRMSLNAESSEVCIGVAISGYSVELIEIQFRSLKAVFLFAFTLALSLKTKTFSIRVF